MLGLSSGQCCPIWKMLIIVKWSYIYLEVINKNCIFVWHSSETHWVLVCHDIISLFSNLLHHWIITWMLLILFLGFTFNLLWMQKCINSLKTRESISLKGAPKNINNALLHLFHQCASFHWCVYYSCQPFMLKLELIMSLYFHTTLWLMHFCCNAWMIKDTW